MKYKIKHNIPLPDFVNKTIYNRIPSKTEKHIAELTNELYQIDKQISLEKNKINDSDAIKAKRAILEKLSLVNENTYGNDIFFYYPMDMADPKNRRHISYMTNYKYKLAPGEEQQYLKDAYMDIYGIISEQDYYLRHISIKPDWKKLKEYIINKIHIDIENLSYASRQLVEELIEEADIINDKIIKLRKGYNIEELQHKGKMISTADILKMEFETFEIGSGFEEIMSKNPSKDFLAMVHGSPGSGKSSFAIRFASYFQNNVGSVGYFSIEEGISRTFQVKLIDNTKYGDFPVITENNATQIGKQAHNLDLCIIDSASHIPFSKADINMILKSRRESPTAFILIYHETKGGDYKGDTKIGHDIDIEFKIENGVISVMKNRFITSRDLKKIKYSIFGSEVPVVADDLKE